MPLLASLEPVLGSTAKVRVLRVLAGAPDRWFTEAEIARRIAMSPNTVNLALRSLAARGVVSVLAEGRAHRVRFNASSLLASPLRVLFASESRAIDRLAEAVAPYPRGGEACILFGSAARGDMTDRSDVDFLVVAGTFGRAAELDVELVRAARRVHPGPYRVLHYTVGELRAKWNTPLVRAIREEGVLLAGAPLEDLR